MALRSYRMRPDQGQISYRTSTTFPKKIGDLYFCHARDSAASYSQVRTPLEIVRMRRPASPIEVQGVFDESDAAAIKHSVIRVEKTRGVVKAYLQQSAVTVMKQIASAHGMLLRRAKLSGGSAASNQANTAANKRNTVKKNPKALKKSQ
jgi:hypothetical protein